MPHVFRFSENMRDTCPTPVIGTAGVKAVGIDPVTGLYPYDSYDCSTHSLTFHHSQQECSSHYIRTRDLRTLLLDTIKTVSAYAISNEAEFIEKVRAASEVGALYRLAYLLGQFPGFQVNNGLVGMLEDRPFLWWAFDSVLVLIGLLVRTEIDGMPHAVPTRVQVSLLRSSIS